jgi:hypothetical protein
VIKTYDPVSGVALKYKTSKAAEVSRLVQMLGGLGRRMAALPQKLQDEPMPDAEPEAAAGAGSAQAPVPGAAAATGGQGQGSAGGGGKGKKKKGKK